MPSEDPNRAGQLTFEDPDLADMRVNRVMRAEGKGGIVMFIYLCWGGGAGYIYGEEYEGFPNCSV